jgi:hypothetical protein
MVTTPYQEAFDRVRAEYVEMPGMRLTPQQLQRLCGVDAAVCQLVLSDLVRAAFLRQGPGGCYARAADRAAASFELGHGNGDAPVPVLPPRTG